MQISNGANELQCRICGSDSIRLIRESTIPQNLSSENFNITDSNYGVTGAIFKCDTCGFLQCLKMEDVLPFYEQLEDAGYEETRAERALQEKRIVQTLKTYKSYGRLLDIGAGSGILVEQALKAGFRAEGVEPSKWLQAKAAERNLPVFLGIFPHPQVQGSFDVITIIDVIEHVTDPVGLLKDSAERLSQDGLVVVVTPDVKSVLARVLSWRWWHFRIAHIGYFCKDNLYLAAEKAGLKPIAFLRPSWYFQGDYLFSRVMQYLPKFLRMKTPGFLKNMTIPLNLRDSMMVIFKKP